MNAARAILEMLKGYEVEYVFGLPGETTLPLYREWLDFPDVKHVLVRDERSSVFAADAYSRFSFKPGVCEGPSVGSTHMIPGMAEAYKASVPLVAFTTDIPLHMEKRNMLTGIDQTALFRGVSKETLTVTDPSEAPNTIRRAFRIATTGKPGPVHVRLPYDILDMEASEPMLHVQKDFARYPGHRPVAQRDKIVEALKLLGTAQRPVMVCGQGVLFSQAWDEVLELAELYGIPVGTTINAKGSMPETHPLSLGVTGARGGTDLSNRVLVEADVVFFVGSSTDSAGTDKWTLPPVDTEAEIITLNISEADAGNTYPADIFLIGDAKATLQAMIEASDVETSSFRELPRIKAIMAEAEKYNEYVKEMACSGEEPVHPVRFVKGLMDAVPEDHCMVMDVGTSAIYTSTFYKARRAGRSLIYNFAMGALGFAIPASIGVRYARPESCIVTLVGDGSFGLSVGELETVARVGGNNNIILFNNLSYGWIRAEWQLNYGPEYVDFATNFKPVDYLKIAEGYGIEAHRVEKPQELTPTLKEAFNNPEPTFIEVIAKPEDQLVPPVPAWIKKAQKMGIRHIR